MATMGIERREATPNLSATSRFARTTIIGRFWVTAEGVVDHHALGSAAHIFERIGEKRLAIETLERGERQEAGGQYTKCMIPKG